MSGTPTYIAYLILALTYVVPVVVVYDPVFLAYVYGLLIHTGITVLPLVWDRKKSQISSKSNTNEQFLGILNSGELYLAFKQAAAESFCSENLLFWENYVVVMQEFIKLYFSSIDKVSGTVVDPEMAQIKLEVKAKDVSALIKKVTRNGMIIKQGSETEKNVLEVPISYSLAQNIIVTYDMFIAAGSPLELNITNEVRENVTKAVEKLREIVDKNFHIMEDGSKLLENVLLVFLDEAPLVDKNDGKVRISSQIFDKVKIMVLEMLYENTLPHYQKVQKVKTLTLEDNLGNI